MKLPSIKELIYDSLINNENGYLTVQELASQVFGAQYGKYTKKGLEDKIRRNIYGSIAMASENGLLVIGKRNNELKGNIIDKWKIAGETDTEDVRKVLADKDERTGGYIKSRNKFIGTAQENKLLPDSDTQRVLKEISIKESLGILRNK